MSDQLSEVMRALFDQAALLATTGPRLPVAFPEQAPAFVTPQNSKYITVEFFPNAPAWEGVAAGVMLQGYLLVTVRWPSHDGLFNPNNVAGQIKTLFAKGTVLINGNSRVTISLEPRIVKPMTDPDGISIPVTVPWVS